MCVCALRFVWKRDGRVTVDLRMAPSLHGYRGPGLKGLPCIMRITLVSPAPAAAAAAATAVVIQHRGKRGSQQADLAGPLVPDSRGAGGDLLVVQKDSDAMRVI